jgi:hypothetical protein
MFPGWAVIRPLINAHDHLELNHFPRTRPRESYASAHDWGRDVNALLDEEPYRSLRIAPLRDRVFIGGLKNLLSGALTVVHHNPPHRPLFDRTFPVCVVRPTAWAHSLGFSTPEEIQRAWRFRKRGTPFFIHAAEGTDARAADELRQLEALGCIDADTVLIHGVGMSDVDIVRIAGRVRALVWCPSTNRYLLNARAPVERWLNAGGRVALGSDSRLTADGDLCDEAAFAHQVFSQQDVERFIHEAAILPHGFKPDRTDSYLLAHDFPARRADIALIVKDGMPLIGLPELMDRFPGTASVDALLDGQPRRIASDLARRILACSLKEPGLYVDSPPARARFLISRYTGRTMSGH